jgi:hypothetical protein
VPDRVERPGRRPGVDIGARLGQRLALAAHMMSQRAAAGGARRHHDFDAVPRQDANRGGVDLRCHDVVDAAGEEGDAALARTLRRDRLRDRGGARPARRRQIEHGGDALEPSGLGKRRQRFGEQRRREREPEAARIGHQPGEDRPQRPLDDRAAVGLLDMNAGVIDEVHVVHP